ncbi:MAG: xanthine dehydrogenase family protein molybdopterin-binding subunit [Gammaproteobacteria bacterium]|nr:xanthine dehydrogenase family protein molybdopterin-binding subunit [Gammaproteobacteria bacterium]
MGAESKLTSSLPGFTRRGFVKATLSATGGLALGFHLPVLAAGPWAGDVEGAEINAWLVIEEDDTVTIRVAQSDMGQGVFTAMPMLVAEELECDWKHVRAEYASANRSLREDRVYRRMGTGGSRAVSYSRPYLQQAGASARERLIAAAAEEWGVPASECQARGSRVSHEASGRSKRYGELAAAAARIELDAEPEIRKPGEYQLLGTSLPRLDVPAKVDGSAVYGIDVRIPGMVYAAIAVCPVWEGRLKAVDASAASAMRGVKQVVKLDDAVAVVADSYWRAKKALEALAPEWDLGEHADASSEAFASRFRAALSDKGTVAEEAGDAYGALETAAKVIEADYSAPYLAHLALEPVNCTVHIQADRVDVWTGSQNPESVLTVTAEESDRPPEQVHVHSCHLGGGFGRRSRPDFVARAVAIARRVDAPVQVIYSREEDTRSGHFRPMAEFRFRAGLDAEGAPVALVNRSATHSILAGLRPEAVANGIDQSSLSWLANSPYAFAHRSIEHHLQRTHVPVWFWRAVGATQNAFALESFLDEMAHAAGHCPWQFRRSLLAERPDMIRVLDAAAEKAGWGSALPTGRGRGIALVEGFGSICAQVAEVEVSRSGEVAVKRVVSALDCGNTVNPQTIDEQVQSSVVYGLSAAFWGKVEIRDGRARYGNFDRHRVLKMAETPAMETHLVLSGGDKWGGVGEPAVPPVVPAVCNAIFAATGKRIRALPLADQDLSWS